MALTKGTNSYVSIAEADAYFVDRADDSTWTSSTPAIQDKALVTAFYLLDDLPWVGYEYAEGQAMAFPRVATIFRPSRGRTYTYEGTETEAPDVVKRAQYELALHLISNSGITVGSSRTVGVDLGGLKVDAIIEPGLIPNRIYTILEGWLRTSPGRSLVRVG